MPPRKIFINSLGQQSWDEPKPVPEKYIPWIHGDKNPEQLPDPAPAVEGNRPDPVIQPNSKKEIATIEAEIDMPKTLQDLRGMIKDELVSLGRDLDLEVEGTKEEIVKAIADRLNIKIR